MKQFHWSQVKKIFSNKLFLKIQNSKNETLELYTLLERTSKKLPKKLQFKSKFFDYTEKKQRDIEKITVNVKQSQQLKSKGFGSPNEDFFCNCSCHQCFYQNAMHDHESFYPKSQSRYAFITYSNNFLWSNTKGRLLRSQPISKCSITNHKS